MAFPVYLSRKYNFEAGSFRTCLPLLIQYRDRSSVNVSLYQRCLTFSWHSRTISDVRWLLVGNNAGYFASYSNAEFSILFYSGKLPCHQWTVREKSSPDAIGFCTSRNHKVPRLLIPQMKATHSRGSGYPSCFDLFVQFWNELHYICCDSKQFRTAAEMLQTKALAQTRLHFNRKSRACRYGLFLNSAFISWTTLSSSALVSGFPGHLSSENVSNMGPLHHLSLALRSEALTLLEGKSAGLATVGHYLQQVGLSRLRTSRILFWKNCFHCFFSSTIQ